MINFLLNNLITIVFFGYIFYVLHKDFYVQYFKDNTKLELDVVKLYVKNEHRKKYVESR